MYINNMIVNGAMTVVVSTHPTVITSIESGTQEFSINGTIDQVWMVDNGFKTYDSEQEVYSWSKTITNVYFGTGSKESPLTGIGGFAFQGDTSLTNVEFGENITFIGNYAFYNCTGLLTMVIPDTLSTLDNGAFQGCSNIAEVTIFANGGDAENVKQMLIEKGVPENITWNLPN